MRVDLLVGLGAPFELKVVDKRSDLNRSQLINYLMLTGFHHVKRINFRPNRVEHEFVNNHVTLAQRPTTSATHFGRCDAVGEFEVGRRRVRYG